MRKKGGSRMSARWLCMGLGLLSALAVNAEPLSLLAPALTGGRLHLDSRLRWEQVDESAAAANADAFTVRARLGYTTSKWNRLDAGIEYSGTAAAAAEEYDSRRNGRTRYSTIADPTASSLHQAWLRWLAPYAFTAKLGRQRLEFDQGRYLGSDDFRQQAQSFDGVTLANDYLPDTVVEVSWLTQANTVLATRLPLQAYVLRSRYEGYPLANLLAYGYWLNFGPDSAALRDTRTLGLRLSGSGEAAGLQLSYALEAAQQAHFANSPQGINARYGLAQISAWLPKLGPVTAPALTLAVEVLGGDGRYGFSTPLASLHQFQGAANLFTTTPADGVRDYQAALSGSFGATTLQLQGHRFDADHDTRHYGDELDVRVERAIWGKRMKLGAQYAGYRAAGFGNDTRKTWLWLEAIL